MSDRTQTATVALHALYEALPFDKRFPYTVRTAPLQLARQFLKSGQPSQTPFLETIFNHLMQTQIPESPFVWPIAPQNLNQDVLFPVPSSQADSPTAPTKLLWQSFQRDWDAYLPFTQSDMISQVELLLGLLSRYAWSIPSGTIAVSLYDEARVTAALSSCLAFQTDAELAALTLESHTPIAQILEGDVSGIQRFIFTVPSQGAAKQLRARSFYLQVLAEAVARFILNEVGVPSTNLIYTGGGHFYLLLPPSVDIADLQSHIDRALIDHHEGELAITLSSLALTGGDFDPVRFGERWDRLKSLTREVKRRRYAQLPHDYLAKQVFEPRRVGDENEIGRRHRDRNEQQDSPSSQPSALRASFEDLSYHLVRAKTLLLAFGPTQNRPAGGYDAALAAFGLRLYVLNDERERRPDPPSDAQLVVWGLQEYPSLDVMREMTNGRPAAPCLRYIVNEVALRSDGEVVDFSELAAASQGIKRLGVLRMDVDGLGTLFSEGFKNKTGSTQIPLTRIASLSSAVSLFFEGWVANLCRQYNADAKNRSWIADDKTDTRLLVEAVYAVYSGGDDLFIVGRWDVLLELANEIRRDLSAFAGGNPNVHISAGLTLHVPKYPLYRAADEADEALDTSKEGSKNAITFLGLTTSWDDWQAVQDRQKHLVDLVQHREIGRALLQTLLRFYNEYEQAQRTAPNDKIVWGPWLWQAAYQITRLIGRARAHGTILSDLRQLLSVETAGKTIIQLGLATLWADISTRNEKEQ